MKMNPEFSWWSVTTSIFAIGALLSTGAFVQRSRDNTEELTKLKERVAVLEQERVEIKTLAVKIENLENRFTELKMDVLRGFEEVKFLIRKESSDIQTRQA